MYSLAVEWTVTLKVESPMHLGSGDEILLRRQSGQPDAEREESGDHQAGTGEPASLDGAHEPRTTKDPGDVRLAVIQRDADGRPYIPGSSLKGALRALDSGAGDQISQRLWGAIKDSKLDIGAMGRLTVFGAGADKTGADFSGIPAALRVKGRKDTFIAAHVAIDPAAGTADEHKLFFREMTASGVVFRPRVGLRFTDADFETSLDEHGARVLKKDRRDEVDRVRVLLGRILKDGLRLGAGSSDADGRLTVDGIDFTALVPGHSEASPPTGAFDPIPSTHQAALWHLTLTCDGPFLIMDGVDRGKVGQGNPHFKPLTLRDGQPWVPGSSLTGALRSRLAWLASLEALRTGCTEKAARDKGRLDAALVFGTEKRRAKLRLARIEAKPAETKCLTSVSLDRFSAAPMDGALFTSETFVGAEIIADLLLDPSADKAVSELVELLLADVASNGLALGAGSAKGFGWFTVKRERLGGGDA